MRAIRPQQPGGPEILVVEEHPTPSPAVGEVLVRIEAAGVNFIDIYQRTGQYPMALPMPLGLEGAGVVEAVGEGVTEVRAGDQVAWAAGAGSYATHVVVAASSLVPVPAGVDARAAAAAMLQGMTAQYLATTTYPLRAGDVCLIHAAAGGVGLLLCQLARRAGAMVIGTVSTEEKAALAREAGAHETILYTSQDFAEEVQRITAGKGVSVVYDSVGKDTFERSLTCLRRLGMLVLYGQSSGAVGPFDPQLLARHGSLFFTRPKLQDYTASREDLLARAGDVLGAIQRGELSVRIGATFPLSQAADAHRALGGRGTTGKVLLLPE
ncbi:quinone oxidoreductase family protein [Chondromyces apiculatus]|uniref:Quinone oxidoreductase n=1 Tax=Chondromyces apiculatus DSM 436 TaxID=1192034 RepID=A0A017SVM2_9BACT|nr:quinone oxidoreductase [Chondromyces apiculatus]EYF00822.1 Quinone oxidoreductase [Chondromyces apiculatus DSM 436]